MKCNGYLCVVRIRRQLFQTESVTKTLCRRLILSGFVSCLYVFTASLPSLQFSTLMLFVGQQEGHERPVKKLQVVGCWHGYLSGERCRLAFSPADATATHCLWLQ